MPKCWFDSETFSTVPIKSGAWRYAEEARVLLFPFAYENENPYVWDLTETPTPPAALIELSRDPAIEFWGHNSAGFDWPVFSHALRWLFDAVPQERRRDTMAQAYAHSLPGSLDALCQVLNIPAELAKDKEGKRLIMLFCVPDKATGKARGDRHSHPKEWEQFKQYAARDITSMRRAHELMPKWNYPNNPQELAVWHLDNRMNARGIAVDLGLARAAIEVAEDERKRLATRTVALTGGQVQSATKRDALLKFLLAEHGVELPDLQGATLERRISDPDLPAELRELLAIRMQASSASTAKYKALINSVSSDGRLRGTSQWCGAARTGRWAHRLFQPGNMMRPPKYIKKQWEQYIAAIKAMSIALLSDNVMEVTGACVRGCIVAPPAKKLSVADLSNIEGRMLAWLAGEEWKLKAFAAFDAKEGPDLYKVSYGRSFGVEPETVEDESEERQIGKVQELMLGYEGGVGAYLTGADTYGIDLDEMAGKALPNLPGWCVREAGEFYDWLANQAAAKVKKDAEDYEARKAAAVLKATYGLARETFVACDAIKRAWRANHAAVQAFWKACGEAVILATQNPGVTFRTRDIAFDMVERGAKIKPSKTMQNLAVRRDGNWLRIRLPSGRFLCYPSPRAEDGKFSYMGINQYSRKWERIGSYSGKLVENITQAAARDQMAYGMLLAEEAGYAGLVSIHDEELTEVPDTDEYTAEGLAAHLAAHHGWNEGLPLAAAGFVAGRYRK